MKKTLSALAAVLLAITITVSLAGCTTTPFKIKITPMKVEINQPESGTQTAAPIAPTSTS